MHFALPRFERRSAPWRWAKLISVAAVLAAWFAVGCKEPTPNSPVIDCEIVATDAADVDSAPQACTASNWECSCLFYVADATGTLHGPAEARPGGHWAVLNCKGNYWTTFTESGGFAAPSDMNAAAMYYVDAACEATMVIDAVLIDRGPYSHLMVLAEPTFYIEALHELRCVDYDSHYVAKTSLYQREVDEAGVVTCTQAHGTLNHSYKPLVPCPADVVSKPLGVPIAPLGYCRKSPVPSWCDAQ